MCVNTLTLTNRVVPEPDPPVPHCVAGRGVFGHSTVVHTYTQVCYLRNARNGFMMDEARQSLPRVIETFAGTEFCENEIGNKQRIQ